MIVANDWLGFRQLYWWRGDGAAAVSTSARALSVLAGGGFDAAGLGAQAMIGWQVGDRTPFADVHALPGATIAELDDGGLELRQYAPPLTQTGPAPSLDDAVDEMAAILRRWQSRYLEAHPDTVLQLTGGHDSRILLGAIPPEQRRGLRALTLGEETHPDVVIAARLAPPVRPASRDASPGRVRSDAGRGARARADRGAGARVPGKPDGAGATSAGRSAPRSGAQAVRSGRRGRARFLLRGPAEQMRRHRLGSWSGWRNGGSSPTRPSSPRPGCDVPAEARERTLSTLAALFEPGDWLRATDAFYLYHRMHRWAAAHGTVAAVRRRAVNPMFDRRFIELALAVAPADKKDSMLLGRLMTTLDPELAEHPDRLRA